MGLPDEFNPLPPRPGPGILDWGLAKLREVVASEPRPEIRAALEAIGGIAEGVEDVRRLVAEQVRPQLAPRVSVEKFYLGGSTGDTEVYDVAGDAVQLVFDNNQYSDRYEPNVHLVPLFGMPVSVRFDDDAEWIHPYDRQTIRRPFRRLEVRNDLSYFDYTYQRRVFVNIVFLRGVDMDPVPRTPFVDASCRPVYGAEVDDDHRQLVVVARQDLASYDEISWSVKGVTGATANQTVLAGNVQSRRIVYLAAECFGQQSFEWSVEGESASFYYQTTSAYCTGARSVLALPGKTIAATKKLRVSTTQANVGKVVVGVVTD